MACGRLSQLFEFELVLACERLAAWRSQRIKSASGLSHTRSGWLAVTTQSEFQAW